MTSEEKTPGEIVTLQTLKSPFLKKVVTRSKPKRHSSVNLQKRFMKNNKPTHCQEEIIKQGKVVCGLESTEELLEEKVPGARRAKQMVTRSE